MRKRNTYSNLEISKRRKKSKMKMRRRQSILLLGIVLVLIIGGISIYSVLSSNNKNEKVLAEEKDNNKQNSNNINDNNKKQNNNNDNKNNDSKNVGQDENSKSKLDNSGYLPLKDDPNADDAVEVAKRTSGLLKGELHYPVRTDGKKVVYLTFDDGPSTTNTPKVLDILDKYNVKATFFIVGKYINASSESKELLKRTAKEGHAIANHSYTHNYQYLYPNRVINVDRFMGEYNKTNKALKEALGKDFSTRVVRFPGGYWSWNGREKARPVLDKNGVNIVDWDALNGDAENGGRNTKEQLIQNTKKNVEKLGDKADSVVFLMHDTYGKENTVKALPEIIQYFKDKGYEFRTIK